MRANQNTFNIKLILFVIAMISVITVFWVNRLMIDQLRSETRQQLEYIAKSNKVRDMIDSSNDEDIFVMDSLLHSLNFPIIITSNNEISAIMNLNIDSKFGSEEYNRDVWKIIEQMDNIFQPLDLKWDGMKWGKLHFGDTQTVTHLRWMPYIEIGFGIIFVIIGFWGLQIIRQGEKNMIYAGMAKETAHQLGTPISSLMGWIKLLRDHKSDTSSILIEMNDDVMRLSEISERFSKIGSNPKLKDIRIYDLIIESVKYMNNRLPKKSGTQITLTGEKKAIIHGDWILLQWAFENLIKNAIDAIGIGKGKISIQILLEKENSIIQITDSGKGIPRKHWKKVFHPGFSNKRRGWGLGLTLTKRIIEQIHGGRIKVLRSGFGETIFQMIFPN